MYKIINCIHIFYGWVTKKCKMASVIKGIFLRMLAARKCRVEKLHKCVFISQFFLIFPRFSAPFRNPEIFQKCSQSEWKTRAITML